MFLPISALYHAEQHRACATVSERAAEPAGVAGGGGGRVNAPWQRQGGPAVTHDAATPDQDGPRGHADEEPHSGGQDHGQNEAGDSALHAAVHAPRAGKTLGEIDAVVYSFFV